MVLDGRQSVVRVLAQILVLAALRPARDTAPPSARGRRSSRRSTWRRSRCSRCPTAGRRRPIAARAPASPWSRRSSTARVRAGVIGDQHLGDRFSSGFLSCGSASRAELTSLRPLSVACLTNAMSSMGLPTARRRRRHPPVRRSGRVTGLHVGGHERDQRGAAGRPALDGHAARPRPMRSSGSGCAGLMVEQAHGPRGRPRRDAGERESAAAISWCVFMS